VDHGGGPREPSHGGDSIWEQGVDVVGTGQQCIRDDEKVFPRVQAVRDARGNDGEDVRGPLGAVVFPHEEPVSTPEDQLPQPLFVACSIRNRAWGLALSAVVRQWDVAVIEKQR
jgi:hypothetical protein